MAIAESISAKLRNIAQQRRRVIIFPLIDELPEELLDILAWDMHVEWYQEDQPIEVKRALIKDSVRVHRLKGTPAAVETAVGAIWPGSKVEEWFEYDAPPYHFRITIAMNNQLTEESVAEALRVVDQTKNLRSHVGQIFVQKSHTETLWAGTAGHTMIRNVLIEEEEKADGIV